MFCWLRKCLETVRSHPKVSRNFPAASRVHLKMWYIQPEVLRSHPQIIGTQCVAEISTSHQNYWKDNEVDHFSKCQKVVCLQGFYKVWKSLKFENWFLRPWKVLNFGPKSYKSLKFSWRLILCNPSHKFKNGYIWFMTIRACLVRL